MVLPLSAQSESRFWATVSNGDTLILQMLPEVVVVGKGRIARRYRKQSEEAARLEYNVRRAYPYARLVAEKAEEIAQRLDEIPTERERKEWLNEENKRLFKEYKEPLSQLTMTQGRILVRLIYRETKKSAYSQIRNLRGGVTAFFWQSVAVLFGNNLKAEYDPFGQDLEIEEIVLQIERENLTGK